MGFVLTFSLVFLFLQFVCPRLPTNSGNVRCRCTTDTGNILTVAGIQFMRWDDHKSHL
jgi:hypothetical protein